MDGIRFVPAHGRVSIFLGNRAALREEHATHFFERKKKNLLKCPYIISCLASQSVNNHASQSVGGHFSLSRVFFEFCSQQYPTSQSLWRDWLSPRFNCFVLNPRQLAVQIFSPVVSPLLLPLKCNLCSLRNISWLFAAVHLQKVTDNGLGKCYLLLQHGDIWISD